MSWQAYYKEHLLDMDSLLDKFPKRDARVIFSQISAEPKAVTHAMAAHKDLFTNVTLYSIMVMDDAPYCRPEMEGHLRFSTIFASAQTRGSIADARADYVPLYYHEYPRYVVEGHKPDVAILHVTPPNKHGWCSFGTSVDFQRAAVDVAQVNDRMPRTLGDNRVHVTEIDWFVEANDPLPTIPASVIGPVERAIGANCASLVRDGDCMQLGIGSIPDAVLKQLADKRDLGIHSEMLSDSVAGLMDAGVITNRRKQLNTGASVATFALGTQALYDFIDDNPAVYMAPVDYTNHPRVICQQDNMVAVNSAIQVDLMGQVCSETVGALQYSGPGGQVDFVRGANMSRGGRNIIALPSTARHGTVSRISPMLPVGNAITTNRYDVNYIVTEYGIAKLWGKNLSERAEALIAIAHPDFREELRAAYKKHA